MSIQHWMDRAAYWRERAERAEAETEAIRRSESGTLADDEVTVFFAVVTEVGAGEVRLSVAADAKHLPSAGARVEVRVRWSPAPP